MLNLNWARTLLCKNGDNLTKSHMKSLKYKGSPGDSNSCMPRIKKRGKGDGKIKGANKISVIGMNNIN